MGFKKCDECCVFGVGGLSSGVFELSSSISTNIKNNKLISGMWEDSPNSSKNIVEKSQLESVENVGERIIFTKYKKQNKKKGGCRKGSRLCFGIGD